MTRNDSDADPEIWMATEPGKRRQQRQPMNWPTTAFGLGFLAFLGVFVWLLFDLIRDLAG